MGRSVSAHSIGAVSLINLPASSCLVAGISIQLHGLSFRYGVEQLQESNGVVVR
jgi:hypothetical protein